MKPAKSFPLRLGRHPVEELGERVRVVKPGKGRRLPDLELTVNLWRRRTRSELLADALEAGVALDPVPES